MITAVEYRKIAIANVLEYNAKVEVESTVNEILEYINTEAISTLNSYKVSAWSGNPKQFTLTIRVPDRLALKLCNCEVSNKLMEALYKAGWSTTIETECTDYGVPTTTITIEEAR